jgi:hypothetical protein
LGDADCFGDRGRGGLGVAGAEQVPGVVEEAVGKVIGVECWRRPAIAAVNAALVAGP